MRVHYIDFKNSYPHLKNVRYEQGPTWPEPPPAPPLAAPLWLPESDPQAEY